MDVPDCITGELWVSLFFGDSCLGIFRKESTACVTRADQLRHRVLGEVGVEEDWEPAVYHSGYWARAFVGSLKADIYFREEFGPELNTKCAARDAILCLYCLYSR